MHPTAIPATTSLTAGFVAPGYDAVEEAFRECFRAETAEQGASFAAIVDGTTVANLCGGHMDIARCKPWHSLTLVDVFSACKGPVAACCALLHSRGELDYAAPMETYWPEFAANGKQRITVDQVLSHQAGLCGLRTPVSIDDLYDWEAMTQRLAAAEPLWTPGTAAAYHAITWGYLAGEIVRRVDGRSVGRFLREELCVPLAADIYLGCPATESPRLAQLVPSAASAAPRAMGVASEIVRLTLGNPAMHVGITDDPRWRTNEIPASNGVATALGLARLYAPLSNAGWFEGRQYYANEAIERATRARFRGPDLLLGIEAQWSAGFFGNLDGRYGPNAEAFGHTGWGGSTGFADPRAHVAVGWTVSRMGADISGDPRLTRLVRALYACQNV